MVSEPEELKDVVNVLVVDDSVAPFRYHVYVNEPVPPVPDAVNVTEFPISVGF